MHLKMGLYLRVHSKFIFKIKNFGRSWKREEYRHKEWLENTGPSSGAGNRIQTTIQWIPDYSWMPLRNMLLSRRFWVTLEYKTGPKNIRPLSWSSTFWAVHFLDRPLSGPILFDRTVYFKSLKRGTLSNVGTSDPSQFWSNEWRVQFLKNQATRWC